MIAEEADVIFEFGSKVYHTFRCPARFTEVEFYTVELVFSTKYMTSLELVKFISSNEFIKMENKSNRILRVVRKYWKEPFIGVENIVFLINSYKKLGCGQ